MSSSKLAASQRTVIRRKVTECYNKSDTYASLSPSDKVSLKGILLNYQKKLIDLNDKVMQDSFTDESDVAALETELTTCQDYFDKIESCLPLLENFQSKDKSALPEVARTLLRQPTAPLPNFSSGENEDFLRFINEFEATTNVFQYPDRDLLLLLKQ